MADVMQAVKSQNDPERLPMLDILKMDVESDGGDFDAVYDALSQGMESGQMRIMRSGNTLLIYTILEPGIAEVHIATADSPERLVSSVQDLYQAMKKAGFKRGITTTENSQIARVLSAAKIPVSARQLPNVDGNVEYELTIEVQ